MYYTTEKPLPLDMRAVFRLVVAATDEHRQAVETVLREFFTETTEGWVNKRADAEIEAMREKQQKQRDKANRRWDMQRAERGNASAMPRHDEPDAAARKGDADAMPPTPTPTPTPTPKKKEKGADALTIESLAADGLTEQTATEFLVLRRAKGAKLTARAWQGIKAEAAKAGWTPERAVCKCLARGWTGFEAAWVAGERSSGVVPLSFKERDTKAKEDKFREMAGSAYAAVMGNVIDMEEPNGPTLIGNG